MNGQHCLTFWWFKKSGFPSVSAFSSSMSKSVSFVLTLLSLLSHLVRPGVFAQGSVLWNVNMGLFVKPEEPTSTRDKNPPTPREEEKEEEEKEEGFRAREGGGGCS